MKTIEELRKEAEDLFFSQLQKPSNPLADFASRLLFRSGWSKAVNELARWHDPEEFPETDVEVLVKIDTLRNKYDIMKHNQHGWWQKAPGGGWCAPKYKPIGWRHIHEI